MLKLRPFDISYYQSQDYSNSVFHELSPLTEDATDKPFSFTTSHVLISLFMMKYCITQNSEDI